ncbi:hypothetical protein [Methylobacterium sp. J-076]|uniref:hypothetical protein n=1 Tax=Methylobacterium sp. J-076 TaxID=2836655 RepID=UPI001FBBB786|nr:hypothetical protein [Methylobacterium sp. J-076]MCJ2012167.1 hypothetical protein [Methylobacterium sp. J-076]
MSNDNSITSRDGYILAQALYIAAKALRSQPYPEWSNAEDMDAILEARFPGRLKVWSTVGRFQEGRLMGLLPIGDFKAQYDTGAWDAEWVEAWIEAGMVAHLNGTELLEDLSDDEARRQLAEARAALRWMAEKVSLGEAA